jgi:hypothetical protein
LYYVTQDTKAHQEEVIQDLEDPMKVMEVDLEDHPHHPWDTKVMEVTLEDRTLLLHQVILIHIRIPIQDHHHHHRKAILLDQCTLHMERVLLEDHQINNNKIHPFLLKQDRALVIHLLLDNHLVHHHLLLLPIRMKEQQQQQELGIDTIPWHLHQGIATVLDEDSILLDKLLQVVVVQVLNHHRMVILDKTTIIPKGSKEEDLLRLIHR